MKTLAFATAGAVLALGAGSASAATVAALTGDATIALVDTESMSVTETMEVSGVEGMLVGIDVRPSDGMLYGLTTGGSVITIDPASGEATEVGTIDTNLAEGVMGFIDFNPAADALRVIGQDGTSLRVNLTEFTVTEDGSLTFAEDDMHAGEEPNVVAGAYTNSLAETETTQLYNIDATIPALVLQDPPNDGVLNAVGPLEGVGDFDWAAFDIVSAGPDENEAWLMAGGTLYEVDLETGAATEVGAVEGVEGEVRDIAILPAM